MYVDTPHMHTREHDGDLWQQEEKLFFIAFVHTVTWNCQKIKHVKPFKIRNSKLRAQN